MALVSRWLFLFLVALAPHRIEASAKLNVVLIVADDLGYRELGSFGQKRIRTPHLDRLASEGMRLTQHYSGNAVCAPSRCVLMTGKHPGHAWVRNNRELKPEGQQPIPKGEVTLGELLQENGYVTGAFGKWGLGGPGSEGDPLVQGFHRFYGYNCQRHAHSYYPSYLWSDDQRVPLGNRPAVLGHDRLPEGSDPTDPASYERFEGKDYAPDRINEQALAFLRQTAAEQKSKPFFLYYPTVIPHLALHVPKEELVPYHKLGWKDPPFTKEKGRGYTPHFTPRAAYAAMISRMDRYVGNILDLLDELGLTNNTLVIFTSDNGTTHLQDEVDTEFFASVGELRGLKGSLYEGGVRVPTIVRWPGKVRAGSVNDYISGFEDWLPTILEAVGTGRVPVELDGISLVRCLTGEAQPQRPFLYREFSGYGGQQSIRVGEWKAVRTNLSRGRVLTELYNLSVDVGEKEDVATQHPEIVARLEAFMMREHAKSTLYPLPPFDTQPNKTPKKG